MIDEPGGAPFPLNKQPSAGSVIKGNNPLYGEWKYQKGGMDTSTNFFGRNQIKRYIKRVIKQEVRKNMENVNYDYHFKSDTHHDQH